MVNGSNVIKYNNISFSNTTNDYSASYRMSDSFGYGNSSLKSDVPSGDNVTSFFFLDIPISPYGNYNANITVCLNSTSGSTIC